jgi:hypothetical protein
VFAAVGECFQRVNRRPHREVRDDVGIVERPDRGGVACLVLQPPDKPGAGLAQRIDRIEGVDELRNPRVTDGGDEFADVQRGKVQLGKVQLGKVQGEGVSRHQPRR